MQSETASRRSLGTGQVFS